jgi:NAD(P)-dependent dehydrogenase (short-subunit alcohol dehydrogenase family)/acyl carrier protein
VRHPQEDDSDVAFLLKTLGQLWLAGTEIDWGSYYGGQKQYRIPLPTYPFERKRYWIDPPKETSQVKRVEKVKEPDIADWFYMPTWKRLPLISGKTNEVSAKSPTLVFLDEAGIGSNLIRHLETQTTEIVKVKIGDAFAKLSSNLYCINPHNADDYQSLIQTLQVQNLIPKVIAHLWNIKHPNNGLFNLKSVEEAQSLGFFSLLYLAQALGQQNLEDGLEMIVVSNQLQNVTGNEDIAAEKATLLGPVRVISREYSNINCRSVDITPNPQDSPGEEKVIKQLLKEMQYKSKDIIIAYRYDTRWVQSVEPVRLEQPIVETLPFKQKGVYLITGGLGGTGLVFAQYLAKSVQAKLILTGRSAFPARAGWEQWLNEHTEEDPTSSSIKRIQQFEAFGAEIMVVRADVANFEQMEDAINQGQNQFGQINGVIHTAGVPGGGIIQTKTWETAQRVLIPKVQGTTILDNLFKDVPLDFMVLFSSDIALTGDFGQVDYCSANNFLDAYAHSKAKDNNRLTISINWDTWQEVGMAASTLKYGLGNKIVEAKKINQSLFYKCIVEKSQKIYVSKFNTKEHWFISEHIVGDKPTMVGTAYLELIRAAYECHSGKTTIELRDVFLLDRMVVKVNEEKEVQTILRFKEGEINFSIQSLNPDSMQWQENAIGKIVELDTVEPVHYDIKDLKSTCNQEAIIPNIKSITEFQKFGPRWWNNIKNRYISKSRTSFGKVELPSEFFDDFDNYNIHPALLDTAFFIPFWKDEESLPFSFKKITIKGKLPAKFYAYSSKVQQINSGQSCNLTILDYQGIEVIAIEQLLAVSVGAEKQKTWKSQPTSSSISSNFLLKSSEPGILNNEGIDCFERIMASDLGQVLVSTYNFNEKNTDISAQGQSDESIGFSENFEKIKTSEVSQNQIEQTLTRVWKQVLGTDNIGVNDNFFEIGGDSLLIIKLRSSLNKMLDGIDIPMNDLLGYTTIRSLADYLVLKRDQEHEAEQSEVKTSHEKPFNESSDEMDSIRDQREEMFNIISDI